MYKFLNKFFNKKKKALVLGGGGARGISHLGILKFIDELGFKPDFIVGTSAGGIFGALYSLYGNAEKAFSAFSEAIKEFNVPEPDFPEEEDKKSILQDVREKLFIAKTFIKIAVYDREIFEDFLEPLFGDKEFSELKIPTYAVALDLISGKDVVFSKGKLKPALLATGALPGIFPPVEYKNYKLVDGGPTEKLPTLIARYIGAEEILAVDVGQGLSRKSEFKTAIEVILRTEDVVSNHVHMRNVNFSDVFLKPPLYDYKWYEFHRYEELFAVGYAHAKSNEKAIIEFFTGKLKAKRINFPFNYKENFIIME